MSLLPKALPYEANPSNSQILGAPSFFPTVWGWIKKWFDPITTSKIFILSQHEVLPTLTQFIDIENIPKKYGGQLEFECGQMPALDPQIRDCLTLAPGPETEKFFLTAPVRWTDENDEGEMTALGVGTLDGQQRHAPVATLHSLMARITTHQSQKAMQEADPLSSRPPPPNAEGQVPILNQPRPAEKVVESISEPVSDISAASSTLKQNTGVHSAPEARLTSVQPPPSTDMAGMTISDPLKANLTNGSPPDKLALPEVLSPNEPTETEFLTPPNDPEVNRQLQ